MYTPYGTDDQVGFFAGQSKQTWAQAVGGDTSGSWARSTLCDAGCATAQQDKPARAAKPTNDTGLQPQANPPGRAQAGPPRLPSPAAAGCVDCAAQAGLAQARRALDVARGGAAHLVLLLATQLLEKRISLKLACRGHRSARSRTPGRSRRSRRPLHNLPLRTACADDLPVTAELRSMA